MEINKINNLESLLANVRNYDERIDTEELRRAYDYAAYHHGEQKRLSGELYITHPLNVAYTLSWLKMDQDSLIAALLHDVVEDTPVTVEGLREDFGAQVEQLVQGVTKISSLKEKSRQLNQAVNIRKILLASSEDVRVIIIKLADKFHNMRTLEHQREEKRQSISQEVLDIYAPLAGRLGIYQVKSALQDLALKHLNPKMYYKIAQHIHEKQLEREQYLQNIKDILQEKLQHINIQAEIKGRAKHFYSIYDKMKRDGKSLEQIYDLHGVRIITEKVKDCYGVLGIVHTLWNPLPGRFKDYIAMPKPNLYQSLHTTVWGPGMVPLEVQIRTGAMEEIAEEGVAAHWRYKEDDKQRFQWAQKMKKWHSEEMDNSADFLRQVKQELKAEEIYVFTPQGEIIELPAGSTPIDFAYHIHTEIGNHCERARINGKMVSLRYELQQGDQVEIQTHKNAEPNASWLKFCKTSHARSKIRSYIRKKEDNLISKATAKEESQKEGGALPSVLQLRKLPQKSKSKKNCYNVEVLGHSDLLVRFAKCCNPVVGDDIVGFITRGRGVSVHKRDCPHVHRGELERERMVDVIWESGGESYPLDITVVGADRPDFLHDLVSEISKSRINIHSADAKQSKKREAVLKFTLGIAHVEELEQLIERLKAIRGVRQVYRAAQKSGGGASTTFGKNSNKNGPSKGGKKASKP